MDSPAPPAAVPAPSEPGERLVALDFIRGIAVMGILGANIVAFGQPFVAYYWPGGFSTEPQPADRWLWAAQFLLIDGKMRGLFTLLFGAGLALFADRSAARGEGAGRQMRRLALLLLFGLAHFYLLWRGDILTLYALCGMLALAAVNWSWVQQASIGGAVWLFGALYGAAMLAATWGAANVPGLQGLGADAGDVLRAEQADGAREIALAGDGSYADFVAHAVRDHTWNWLDLFLASWLETLPIMLVGMALYRAGLFDGRIDAKRQLRWGWAGVIVGTAAAALVAAWALRDGPSFTGAAFAVEGAGAVARIPVVLGLAALLAVWGRRAHGWLAERVVAAGRMAFSNYLGTSLAMLFVFQAPGLRLFGALGRMELYFVVLVGWLAMLAWSKPWLARFRYGPLEWLWRCLTYGRRIPLRR